MKQPTVGQSVRVIIAAQEYAAVVVEVKPDATVCRVDFPGGPRVMWFRANGQGLNGARLKKMRTVGVRVKDYGGD